MAAGDKKATATAVVASGRTVQGVDGKSFAAGSPITLASEEIDRLQGLGFLAQSGDVATPSGPSLTTSDGPQIQVS